jgi:hypothetical protein
MKIILSGEMDINTSARVLSSDYYEIFNLFFANKKYSEDEIKLGILYICRPFKLNRRKSYYSDEKLIAIDVILDYDFYVKNPPSVCKEDFLLRTLTILDYIEKLSKSKIPDFNFKNFKVDLEKLIDAIIKIRIQEL